MSLMLRLLAITVVLSSLIRANDSDTATENFLNMFMEDVPSSKLDSKVANSTLKNVETFLTKMFTKNPNIKSIKVKVTNTMAVKQQKNWNAYFIFYINFRLRKLVRWFG